MSRPRRRLGVAGKTVMEELRKEMRGRRRIKMKFVMFGLVSGSSLVSFLFRFDCFFFLVSVVVCLTEELMIRW